MTSRETLPTVRALFVSALAIGATAIVGCGGGGTTATPTGAAALPTPVPSPVAVVPDVRDGDTGAPVADAVSTPPLVMPGAPLAVTAPGYLRRQQFLSAAAPIFLWPQDESYVRRIVYAGGDYGLIRWTGGFRVKPWPGTEDKMAIVLAEVSRVTGLPITITDGPAEVELVFDPAEPELVNDALAITFRTFSGLTIVRSRIVFRSIAEFIGLSRLNGGRPNTALHEMGHVLGLDHSNDYRDVMSQEDDRNPTFTFGRKEELALRMMYSHRAPGNAAPDRAPGVPTSTTLRAPRAVVVD
jgi:hypothetical protein